MFVEISSKRLGATVVQHLDTIVGIITDGDLRRMLETKLNINEAVASDFMTVNPKKISKSTLVTEAFHIMNKNSISQLVIMDKNKYIGMIHLHDVLKQNII